MHKHHTNSIKNIKTAFFLNVSFTFFELIGGYYTNSMAIMSDALHDLGDSISLGISWYLEKKSGRDSDSQFTFGYQRFSLLGALINSVVLIAGSLYILSEVIPRLVNPVHSNAKGMFVFALIGIAVNGLAVLRLRRGSSMNERVVSWHLLEDVLGWFAVLIVSIFLIFKDLPVLDPALSLLIILYVMFNVIRNLKKTMHIFLQGAPDDISTGQIENDILAIEGVQSLHQTKVWSLDGEEHVLTIHVVIDNPASVAEIVGMKHRIKAVLQAARIRHATVEIELSDEACYMD
ncbi:MAG: cation diffusion facilitator family transporter, partial [Flavobacteriales bacterium]